jgi:glyoxylase-like metal-dependent hydrolase (beta-lactamase superfamily II)
VKVTELDTGMRELADGLWQWDARHPEWHQPVTSHLYRRANDLILIDPMLPSSRRERERLRRVLERHRGETPRLSVLITLHYHRRSAGEIARWFDDARVYAPRDHLERFPYATDALRPGRRIVGDVDVLPTVRADEVVLWLRSVRAVVAGDVLLGGKRKPLRLCPQGWLPRSVTRAELAASLQPLRELPVQRIVLGHGPSILANARAELERALADTGNR